MHGFNIGVSVRDNAVPIKFPKYIWIKNLIFTEQVYNFPAVNFNS
jgi:hypothetical protein